jgi:YidC/Oxa1 family membrane protein insertase
MEALFGGIQRGLGAALNGIYEVVGSYGLAIILLTLVVRAVMIPLTIKQTRSMKAMQELQPQMKAIQGKYKELQKKAKDRVELQQIRLEMNRELQGLYREHGANPAAGCLPLLAQMPVFIAMFSIMRASIIVLPAVATLPGGAPIPADAFEGKELRTTVCRPYDQGTQRIVGPDVGGESPETIACIYEGDHEPDIFEVADFRDRDGKSIDAGFVANCKPKEDGDTWRFECNSALGSGHVPQDGELFEHLAVDGADILTMHPGCSATSAASDSGIRACTATKESSGPTEAFPYYILVGLIVVSSYYQTKQMQSRNPAQVTDQQRMITRIMPVFFGFISLSIPAGANTYFLASNLWTIGQQHIMFKDQNKAAAEAAQAKEKGPRPNKGPAQTPPSDKAKQAPDASKAAAAKKPPQKRSNKSKKRKKRR